MQGELRSAGGLVSQRIAIVVFRIGPAEVAQNDITLDLGFPAFSNKYNWLVTNWRQIVSAISRGVRA